MLPPVLEIYVVWHPRDDEGMEVAMNLMQHFHGNRYTGLISGAVEVFVRFHQWRDGSETPRPIPFPGALGPNGLEPARLTVVVPVLGLELVRAVNRGSGPWYDYCADIAKRAADSPRDIAVFPFAGARRLDSAALHQMFPIQAVEPERASSKDLTNAMCCRDLAQAITRFAGGLSDSEHLKVFISHTLRTTSQEQASVVELVERVRRIIGQSRLPDFFAPHDLQPGADWSEALKQNAKSAALLALRTDLYASRTWCQREILVAKRAGMPIVILDALGGGEERGSFLMDHVPRVPVRQDPDGWRDDDIRRGLNALVDECLKRVLWRRQREIANDAGTVEVGWWAPHAPEPATLADWLVENPAGHPSPLRILHPDPPLGPDEIEVLHQMTQLAGITPAPDFLTPRQLSSRGA